MDESYLYESKEYRDIVVLIKKIYSSLVFEAPEAKEHKYYLLAEKYSHCFDMSDDDEDIVVIKLSQDMMLMLDLYLGYAAGYSSKQGLEEQSEKIMKFARLLQDGGDKA